MTDQNTFTHEMTHWQAKLTLGTQWQLNRKRHYVMRAWRMRDDSKTAFWGITWQPVATYAAVIGLIAASLVITFSTAEPPHGLDPLSSTSLAAAECKTCAAFNGCYL